MRCWHCVVLEELFGSICRCRTKVCFAAAARNSRSASKSDQRSTGSAIDGCGIWPTVYTLSGTAACIARCTVSYKQHRRLWTARSWVLPDAFGPELKR